MGSEQLEPDSPGFCENEAVVWQSAAGNIIEISYDSGVWPLPEISGFERLATGLLDHISHEFSEGAIELGLLLCDDSQIQKLNRQFRGKDKPTNILSFPEPESNSLPGAEDGATFIGDMAIAYETLAKEAADLGLNFADHLAHLFVHGIMHLLGYDHEDDAEAQEMEMAETAILAAFSIADPYAAIETQKSVPRGM